MPAKTIIEADFPDSRPYETELSDAFGQHVGLNADWSGSAWCVWHDGQGPNRGRGIYVFDGEDKMLYLVARQFEPEEFISNEVLAEFPEDQVKQVIAAAKRARSVMAHHGSPGR